MKGEVDLSLFRTEVPQSALRYVAVCDVLGFSAFVEENDLDHVARRYWSLLEMARYHAAASSVHSRGCGEAAVALRSAVFSDTFFLWSAPLPEDPGLLDLGAVSLFFDQCNGLIGSAVSHGLPLRVGVAYGRVHIESASGFFVGRPIVDAYKLEEAQNWVGGACHSSCEQAPFFDRVVYPWKDVLEYSVPVKPGTAPSQYALNWCRAGHSRDHTSLREGEAENAENPSVATKYSNALAFLGCAERVHNWSFEEEAAFARKHGYLLGKAPSPEAL